MSDGDLPWPERLAGLLGFYSFFMVFISFFLSSFLMSAGLDASGDIMRANPGVTQLIVLPTLMLTLCFSSFGAVIILKMFRTREWKPFTLLLGVLMIAGFGGLFAYVLFLTLMASPLVFGVYALVVTLPAIALSFLWRIIGRFFKTTEKPASSISISKDGIQVNLTDGTCDTYTLGEIDTIMLIKDRFKGIYINSGKGHISYTLSKPFEEMKAEIATLAFYIMGTSELETGDGPKEVVNFRNPLKKPFTIPVVSADSTAQQGQSASSKAGLDDDNKRKLLLVFSLLAIGLIIILAILFLVVVGSFLWFHPDDPASMVKYLPAGVLSTTTLPLRWVPTSITTTTVKSHSPSDGYFEYGLPTKLYMTNSRRVAAKDGLVNDYFILQFIDIREQSRVYGGVKEKVALFDTNDLDGSTIDYFTLAEGENSTDRGRFLSDVITVQSLVQDGGASYVTVVVTPANGAANNGSYSAGEVPSTVISPTTTLVRVQAELFEYGKETKMYVGDSKAVLGREKGLFKTYGLKIDKIGLKSLASDESGKDYVLFSLTGPNGESLNTYFRMNSGEDSSYMSYDLRDLITAKSIASDGGGPYVTLVVTPRQ